MRGRTTLVIRWTAWGLGLGLIALLIHRVGLATVRDELARVGPKIVWMFAAYAAGTALGAVPWRQLMPDAARPTWGAVVSSRFAASGINAVLPFFGAGEAGRLLWIERRFWPAGVAALIVDRLLFVMAGAFILVAGVIAALRIPSLPRLYDWSGGLIAAVILLGPVVLALIGARGRLMGRLARAVRFLRRNGGHSPAVPSALEPEGVDPRDEALRAVLAGSKKRLGAALATHVGSRLLLAAEIYAGLRVLGVHATPGETLVFVAVPIALSVVGTFVPGQIGLQETVQAFVA
ncbi:MAG TPA: lysylphosphatidylglycerol synthase transmembrane domain-containing protein, partial [Polyangia bacterium]|nr:lysylphosphatidylglycerol synthase transmembrane domain-containing protein [Polyangia bacterium]